MTTPSKQGPAGPGPPTPVRTCVYLANGRGAHSTRICQCAHTKRTATGIKTEHKKLVGFLRFICRGLLCFLRDMAAVTSLQESAVDWRDSTIAVCSSLIGFFSGSTVYCWVAALRPPSRASRMTCCTLGSSATNNRAPSVPSPRSGRVRVLLESTYLNPVYCSWTGVPSGTR